MYYLSVPYNTEPTQWITPQHFGHAVAIHLQVLLVGCHGLCIISERAFQWVQKLMVYIQKIEKKKNCILLRFLLISPYFSQTLFWNTPSSIGLITSVNSHLNLDSRKSTGHISLRIHISTADVVSCLLCRLQICKD